MHFTSLTSLGVFTLLITTPLAFGKEIAGTSFGLDPLMLSASYGVLNYSTPMGDPKNAHTGSSYLRTWFSPGTGDNNYASYTYSFTAPSLKTKKTYITSIWAKSNTTAAKKGTQCGLGIEAESADGGLDTNRLLLTQKYAQVRVEFDVGPNSTIAERQITVYLEVTCLFDKGMAYVDLDDFSVSVD